jgi:hypothetical protein
MKGRAGPVDKVRRRWLQRRLLVVFAGVIALVGSVSCGHAASEQKASYWTRVKYSHGKKIEFPDFSVEYLGGRRKTVPSLPERLPLLRFQGQQRKG